MGRGYLFVIPLVRIVGALHYQVRPVVSCGELMLLLERFEPKSRPLSIVYPKNRLGSVRVSSFVDLFASKLRRVLSTPHSEAGCCLP